MTLAEIFALAPSPAFAFVRLATAQEARKTSQGGVQLRIGSAGTGAQVSQRLMAMGDTNVKLTTQLPNPRNIHPELYPDADTETSAAHVGWNGSTNTDGHAVNGDVDPLPTRSARAHD